LLILLFADISFSRQYLTVFLLKQNSILIY
jgi:hypothetical protein